MVIKKSEIREAINEVLRGFGNDEKYKPYTTKDQWRDETEIFMTGLKNGDFVEFGDRSIGVEWRGGGASNDPRFIVFEFGDARLRDDHFYIQHSPRLSDDQLKDIRDVMVRMGMVSKEEFDMEYGLNMDNSYYESRIDRVVRDTINEAMWTKMPEDGNFPPFKGRKPKTPKARINQIYSLVQKYGLSSKKYKDDHWQAADDYDKLFKALGYDVDWSVNNGGYGDYSEFTGRDMSKTYNIILTAEDGMQIEGYVKMCAAGSNEDPFDAYDTCIILWNKPKRRYDESIIRNVVNENVTRLLREWDASEPDEDYYDYPEENYQPYDFYGVYDLSTDEIYDCDDTPEINITEDEFGGQHNYVHFTAVPYFNVHEDHGDNFTPAGETEIEITGFDISPDKMMYTTNEYQGSAYYEDDESTKEPFNGFTPEQKSNIEHYLGGMSIDDWGFFD